MDNRQKDKQDNTDKDFTNTQRVTICMVSWYDNCVWNHLTFANCVLIFISILWAPHWVVIRNKVYNVLNAMCLIISKMCKTYSWLKEAKCNVKSKNKGLWRDLKFSYSYKFYFRIYYVFFILDSALKKIEWFLKFYLLLGEDKQSTSFKNTVDISRPWMTLMKVSEAAWYQGAGHCEQVVCGLKSVAGVEWKREWMSEQRL